jgi:hypothetical protein
MPGRRMLRDMMSVNDIYSYADSIIELLREEYGTYDADTLDEVQVEDRFAQRLEARGYEVRSPDAAPAPAPAPTPLPAAATPSVVAQETPIVPVTVVRTRRTAPGTSSGTTTRTRRTTTPGSDGTHSTPGSTPSRASAESASAESSADSSADSSAGADSPARPTRTRRTTRPRTSNNGDTSS